MKLHTRKMIAPIVISVIMLVYFVAYFGFLISVTAGIGQYLMGILALILAVLDVAVLIERIKEIKSGEEDDISKY